MQIRSGMKCLLAAAFSTSLLLGATSSRANGRFPRGEHLIEHPNPKRLTLAATYGIVNTEDGGKTWSYICETAFSLNPPPLPGEPGFVGDPMVTLLPDESLIVGVQKRINLSTDNSCGWQKVYEDATKTVDDIAIAPSSPNTLFALVSTLGGATNIQLYQSTDTGRTWAAVGVPLPIVIGLTLDVDPTDPKHIYVTGLTSAMSGPDTGVLVSTSNAGMSWTLSTIPKTNLDAPPYIAAVHPTDPKKIFVRTDEWTDSTVPNDALMYTKDGGQTWTELIRPVGPPGSDDEGIGAKLFGFAISPDGNTILAGYGDPVQGGGRNVARSVTGVYKSSGADFSFGTAPKPIFSDLVSCLTWTSNGVYVCASPDGAPSYIGFAKDISMLSSAGITKIMKSNEFTGAPACCNGRARTTCDWATDCTRFQACGTEGGTVPPYDASACMSSMPEPAPDAGRDVSVDPPSDVRPDNGTGGNVDASTDGGPKGGAAGMGGSTTGTGGAAGSSSGGTGGASTGSGGSGGSSDDGCSCRLGGSNRDNAGRLALLLAAGAVATLRRRRRERRA